MFVKILENQGYEGVIVFNVWCSRVMCKCKDFFLSPMEFLDLVV